MKKIAILQSNYIPWKGYFDLINSVDEFIFYDDMQFTRRDWRNRNKIKTQQGLQWLTIPVQVKGKYFQTIQDTTIAQEHWASKHWQTIIHHYSNSSYFHTHRDLFEDLFLASTEQFLSKINYRFILAINELLSIQTNLRWSNEFKLSGEKSEKLLNICKDCNATHYISGPKAKDYLDLKLFEQENIKVSWMNYDNYPIYHQSFPPFEHGVTILDLIFNEGPNASKFMKSFQLD